MFRNAFNCKRCPQTNTSDGCPAWWEFQETNHETGQVRVVKGCRHEIEARYIADHSQRLDALTAHVSRLERELHERMAVTEDLTAIINLARNRTRLGLASVQAGDVEQLVRQIQAPADPGQEGSGDGR